MLRHPCGSRVINELYTAASTKQRRALTAEFYGRETALFQKVLLCNLASTRSHAGVLQSQLCHEPWPGTEKVCCRRTSE